MNIKRSGFHPAAHTDASCTLRTYGFDQRGNRTSQGTATTTNGTCPTTATSSVTRAYDAADRPVTAADGQSTYVYDELGRQTLIPAADAAVPAGGNITLGYFDDNTAKTITQADTTLAYSLDVAGRRHSQTTTTGGSTTSVVTNHYTDTSDSPGWITTLAGGATATTVFAELVGSDLSLSLITDTTGQRGELALTTPRGDIAATTTLTTPDTPATGIDSYTRYTEYGQPVTPQPTATTGAAGNGYGWLGAKQRTTTDIGILLMGARLYNVATGLFTSIDPVYGGNETAYGYPSDPISYSDVTGRESRKNWVARQALSVLACRAAGKFGCSMVALVTVHALNLTKKYKNSEAKNAIRHFLWVAGLSLVMGRDHARSIAAAHESGLLNFAETRADSRRDRANNAFTLTWMKNKYGTAGSPFPECIRTC